MKKWRVLLLLAVFSAGCAVRSFNFVGVSFVGRQRVIGGVSAAAGKMADNFLKAWLNEFEAGNLDKCYESFSERIKQELPFDKFKTIKTDLDAKYGQTQASAGLEMPMASFFPALDEANFQKSAAAGIQYYRYIMGRYLNKRPGHNLVYFLGVAFNEGRLEIVSFGIGEEVYDIRDDVGNYLHWFGYSSF